MYCLDLYEDYADVNDVLGLEGEARLSNDRNVEDPLLIVGTRKWSWDDMPEEGPRLWFLGTARMVEHVRIHDKYDVFIYGI